MSTKDKVLSVAIRMCDTMYDEKVKHNGYRSLLGTMHLDMKKEYPVNEAVLNRLVCKGKCKRKLSHHQICQGASQYALQFYLFEGYSIFTSKKMGCLVWNNLNNVRYFDLDDDLDYTKQDKLSSKSSVLMKMCRLQHLVVDYEKLKTLTALFGKKNNLKEKKQTYWACFKEAMRHIPKDTTDITEDLVTECLRKWNREKNIDLFNV